MDFLIPQFLWALPIASVPFIIHFLNRNSITKVSFSTIQFLQKIENKSIKRLNLIHLLLLIIRTLVILLLILAASRPSINSNYSFDLQNSNNDLTLIYFDTSLSSMGLRDEAYREDHYKRFFNEIVSTVDEQADIYIGTGSEPDFYYGKKDGAANLNLSFLDGVGRSDVYRFIHTSLHDLDKSLYLNKEIHIISDGDVALFDEIADNSYIDGFNIYIYVLPELKGNVGLGSLSIENTVIVPDIPFSISAQVINSSSEDNDNVLAQLFMNDVMVGQKYFDIGANINKKIEFVTTIPTFGRHNGYIALTKDAREEDNVFFFSLDSPRDISFDIHYNNHEDLLFIKSAIRTIFEEKSESINVTEYDLESEIEYNRKSDIAFVFGFDALTSFNDIAEYRNYKVSKMIFFPSYLDTSVPQLFIEKGIFNQEALNTSKEDGNFFSLNLNSLKSSLTKYDPTENQIEVYKYFPMKLSSQTSESIGSEGVGLRINRDDRVEEYFSFAINRSWTNFPMKGLFLPFVYNLSLSDISDINVSFANFSDSLSIKVPLKSTKYSLIGPNNLTIGATSNMSNIVKYPNPREKGVYGVYDDLERSRFALNHDTDDINPDIIDSRIVSQDNIYFIDSDEIASSVQAARVGSELWKMLLFIVFALIAIEMLLSNRSQA